MSKYTQKSIGLAESEGYLVGVVERWIQQAMKRIDLFGCIDLVAVHPEHGTLGIQSCPFGSRREHAVKAMNEPRLRDWLRSGTSGGRFGSNRFEVWAWDKRRSLALRKDGQRSTREVWVCRRERILLVEGKLVVVDLDAMQVRLPGAA